MASAAQNERTRRKDSLLPFPVPVEHLGKPPKKGLGLSLHSKTRFRLLMVCITLLILAPIVGLVVHLATLAPHATIVITPQTSEPSQTMVVNAVTGTPNPGQLQAQVLESSQPAQQTTASATGVTHQSAQKATGQITFYNGNTSAITLDAGIVLNANGVQIITLSQVTVPAVIINGTHGTAGQANVPAQARLSGPSGNIPVKAINDVPCCAAGITAQNNQAFSGGQDAATYTVVKQEDIDAATAPLIERETQTAKADLIRRVQAPEQLVETSLTCTPTIQANPTAGSRADKTSISVSASCQAEAYNSVQASSLASSQFVASSLRTLGSSYALYGQVSVGTTQASTQNGGTISLAVQVRGQFLYQLDQAALKHLLPRIAGMRWSEAQTLLSKQAGVAKVEANGIAGDTLPSDVSQIDITVQPPSALHH
jgi:hypothetical protein